MKNDRVLECAEDQLRVQYNKLFDTAILSPTKAQSDSQIDIA